MKILVLSNLYPPHYVGGYELHCQSIVEALRARGHTVHVLTSDHGLEQDETTVTERGTRRSLKIHGMFGHPWLGIHQLFALERHNNQTLLATIKTVQPDLIYVWSLSGLSKSLLFSLQDSGIPTSFVVCDHWIARSQAADVWTRWWNRKDATIRHRLLRTMWTLTGARRRCQKHAPTNPVHQLRFQRLYFCSKALRDFTAAAGFPVEHGAVIYCPIKTNLFTGDARPASHPLQRLLYVGRLTEDKGVMTAIQAMALVRDKFAGKLSVYGRGDAPYERELHAFVEDHKLAVDFASVNSPEAMPPVYLAHDALLFTSEWPEPFALTPLEAMASGLPVIGTMTGGSAELFRHGENALTYSAGNPEELAQRILELDKNSALRAKIALAGQKEVRARFDEPVIVDQVEAYLKETVASWKPIKTLDYAA